MTDRLAPSLATSSTSAAEVGIPPVQLGAADQALTIHRNPESIATVFDVTDETGHTERIDLAEAEDEEACVACGREFDEDESIVQAPTGKTYCRACFDQGQG